MHTSVFDSALGEFLRLVRDDPAASEELESARAEFLGVHAPPLGSSAYRAAERRFLEWFVLERPSTRLSGVPFRALGERFAASTAEVEPGAIEALLGSRVGVFEVLSAGSGEAVWLRDLCQGEHLLAIPDAHSAACEEGDVLAGRIFPLTGCDGRGSDSGSPGAAIYRLSWAAGHFRSGELLDALRIDLGSARSTRRGVLRLAQSELEKMFWNGQEHPSPQDAADEDAREKALRLLREAGVEEEEILAAVESPSDPRVVPGSEASDHMTDLLNRLAFESHVDLEAARRALLALRTSSAPVEIDPRPAIAAFERERESGADLDAAIHNLEQALGLDPEPLPPAERAEATEDHAPDFPGVVRAMVEEFRWEASRERGSGEIAGLEFLFAFAEFTSRIGVFEDLGRRDVLAFLALFLPEHNRRLGAADARRAVAAMDAFCRWAESSQQHPLFANVEDALQSLKTSLPRIARANLIASRSESGADAGASPHHGGAIYAVANAAADGVLTLQSSARGDFSTQVDAGLAACLAPGDRVRARGTDGGQLAVLCCYPPESAEILPGS